MRKLYAAILSAAICLAVSGAPAWASEHQSTLSAGYLHASTNVSGSDDLNGINVKYRYEFTDTLGMVTSFSYAGDKNRQLTRYSDTRWHEDSVRNRWFSVMAGPSVRVNEWFSAYAMAGVAYSRVSTFSGDYLRVTDNKGKTHDVLTGSDDGRHSNTSLAWGAGVQFNPTESVAIDIAYEGSGSGDWRTDGFIVGVGYRPCTPAGCRGGHSGILLRRFLPAQCHSVYGAAATATALTDRRGRASSPAGRDRCIRCGVHGPSRR